MHNSRWPKYVIRLAMLTRAMSPLRGIARRSRLLNTVLVRSGELIPQQKSHMDPKRGHRSVCMHENLVKEVNVLRLESPGTAE